MFRQVLAALVLLAVVCGFLSMPLAPAQASNIDAPAVESEASPTEMANLYFVQYRAPSGGRWRQVGPYSLYHASQAANDLRRKGYVADLVAAR